MKTKGTILTREERDVLILAATHSGDQHLSNTEISQRLGISVSKVKTLIHQACVKLEASNRYEAIHIAIRRGEISINEFFSLDELAEILSALHPYTLRRIIHIVREGLEYGHFLEESEQIIRTIRRQDSMLTKSEKDVLGLVGRGLTNREIADTLQMSISTVGTFVYRVCTKLGARNRSEAFVLALKRGEVGIDDIFSLNELLQYLVPLGDDSLEEIAQLLSQKLKQKPVATGS